MRFAALVATAVAVTLTVTGAVDFSRPSCARADMLAPGTVAPDFSGQSVYDGKVETFSLKDQLKNGAVVLYFFPAAFTSG